MKANPYRNAKGTVIEAGLDKSKGPTATLIVQNGTLRKGDVVVCGEAFGKVGFLNEHCITTFREMQMATNLQCYVLHNLKFCSV